LPGRGDNGGVLETIGSIHGLADPAHAAGWWSTLAGWSSLGAAVGGFSAAVLAVTAFIGGAAALKPWRENLHAQRDLAREQENGIRLERLSRLDGWSPGTVSVYGVRLVTDKDEMTRAQAELLGGDPTAYVILGVSENSSGNENRARSLRQLIETGGYLARHPTPGEYQALEEGSRVLLRRPQPGPRG
jgi:hypothetical protein